MSHRLGAATLVPRGFAVERINPHGRGMEVVIRATCRKGLCPDCGRPSSRTHSRYWRTLGDLPLAGRPVRLRLMTRRFRCGVAACRRQIFAERFGDAVAAPWARRTGRLDLLVYRNCCIDPTYSGLRLAGRIPRVI
jgi:hypothetical protein